MSECLGKLVQRQAAVEICLLSVCSLSWPLIYAARCKQKGTSHMPPSLSLSLPLILSGQPPIVFARFSHVLASVHARLHNLQRVDSCDCSCEIPIVDPISDSTTGFE